MVQESGWDEGLREHASAGAAPAREWHHRFQVETCDHITMSPIDVNYNNA